MKNLQPKPENMLLFVLNVSIEIDHGKLETHKPNALLTEKIIYSKYLKTVIMAHVSTRFVENYLSFRCRFTGMQM